MRIYLKNGLTLFIAVYNCYIRKFNKRIFDVRVHTHRKAGLKLKEYFHSF